MFSMKDRKSYELFVEQIKIKLNSDLEKREKLVAELKK